MKKIYKLLSVALVLSGSLTLNAQTWEPIGNGTTASVSTIIIDGNDIYANGNYQNGSDVFSYGKFSGGQWFPLGNWKGVSGGIGVVNCALKVGDDIYVGGVFIDGAGNPDMDRIARWNITTQTWHPLGTGLNQYVNSIVQMGSDIIVGGKFTNAGGDANADFVAKWDGSSWSALSSTVISTSSFTSVNALAVSGSDLYIGGNFENAAGNSAIDYITKWDGNSFSSVGGWSGQVGAVFTMDIATNGDLYIGGEFPLRAAKFDGTNWSILGSPTAINQLVREIKVVGSDVYIGGNFTDVAGVATADYIARFDGTNWYDVGGGLNAYVAEIVSNSGDLYVGGNFTDAGGNTIADKIVKIGISTAIEETTKTNATVFPNPTNGIVYVTMENNVSTAVELYNVVGEKLSSDKIQGNTYQLNLTSYPSGVYFLKLNNKTTKILKK
ncbi:MAG: T9SS type A sorting domain-containing protein [Flavobacteriales bacterium]|nr:T9SS type A sorting domain-containing protein [Flavobacteriales bacterium]